MEIEKLIFTLNEKVTEREEIKDRVSGLSQDIMRIKADIKKEKENKKTIESPMALQIRTLREELRALRISVSKYLQVRGYTMKEIEGIFGVSYASLKQAERLMKRDAGRI